MPSFGRTIVTIDRATRVLRTISLGWAEVNEMPRMPSLDEP